MNVNFYKFHSKTFLTKLYRRLFPLIGPKNVSFKQVPSFGHLSDDEIRQHTNIEPNYSFRNQLYWIPRFYLHKDISFEFVKEIKKFKKLSDWKNAEQLALTQLVLTEAIRDTTYEIAYNYEVKPSLLCPLHGTIDILLYNNIKEENYLPVVPIVFPQRVKSPMHDEWIYKYSIPQLVGICSSLLSDFKARDLDIDCIKAFHTNGDEWCLFEVHDNYVKRTKFFRSQKVKSDRTRYRIYEDTDHMETIIGLIRYALSN
jgi:hypothetical protein